MVTETFVEILQVAFKLQFAKSSTNYIQRTGINYLALIITAAVKVLNRRNYDTGTVVVMVLLRFVS